MDYFKIGNDLNIKVVLDHDTGFRDGGCSSDDTVFLYPCSTEWIKELSFWHELGHILYRRSLNGRSHCFSTISMECMAWELGLNLAASYGRHWGYDSIELKWARKQLASYVNSEYDDLKKFYLTNFK